jgi:ABC-2 type transport system ATP-binding protein
VLLTTQYLDEADALADRVAVMDRGKVVANGTVDELKAKVGGSSVKLTLVDSTQAIAAARTCAAFSPLEVTVEDDGNIVSVPMPDIERLPEMLLAARSMWLGRRSTTCSSS